MGLRPLTQKKALSHFALLRAQKDRLALRAQRARGGRGGGLSFSRASARRGKVVPFCVLARAEIFFRVFRALARAERNFGLRKLAGLPSLPGWLMSEPAS